MADAMVTARMSPAKKELGAQKLAALGTNPSQFINSCYDYVIQHDKLPIPSEQEAPTHTPEEVIAAKQWIEHLHSFDTQPGQFDTWPLKDVRLHRLGIHKTQENPMSGSNTR